MNERSSQSSACDKAALRLQAKQERAALAAQQGPAAAQAVAGIFMQAIALQKNQIVAGYWPHQTELSCVPLLDAIAGQGGACALPVMAGPECALAFRHWMPGAPLRRGDFGIFEPLGSAPEVRPDVVLVPLLSFDRAGHRLGYGLGFYDRTLQALRRGAPVLSIGLAFAGQEAGGLLPKDPHDQPLDWIVTEREAYRVKS